MLGKGLESLIPPHRSSDELGSGQAPKRSMGNDDGQSVRDDGSHDFTPASSPVEPPTYEQPPVVSDLSRAGSKEAEPKLLDDLKAHLASVGFGAPETSVKPAPRASVVPPAPRTGSFPKPADRPKNLPDEYIYHIEVEKIKPNSSQPRRNFDEAGIRELAFSIREFGFLQPLVVTKVEKETPDGVEVEYQLIAGERRLMAAKTLGLTLVPAIIRNVDLEREKLELAVIENIQREGLNPIDTARAFARLQDEFRLTQREIAAKLGKSREVVANSVRLLGLPMYIQLALEKGGITESHGRLLLAIEDPASQKKLFDDIIAHGMTTRDLRARVMAAKPRKAIQHEPISPELRMMEDKLSAELGTPVKIEKGMGSGPSTELRTGKIVIQFFSEEELENLVHKIGKEEGS
ncbi:MAG: ParB/RepB/Spo0J family partition protein [Candidatus Liptonbacteria bacterium]|nr:ParB/RepB/Spo0J family partition protein [Candidatus Liptonbacteria bacterium]